MMLCNNVIYCGHILSHTKQGVNRNIGRDCVIIVRTDNNVLEVVNSPETTRFAVFA